MIHVYVIQDAFSLRAVYFIELKLKLTGLILGPAPAGRNPHPGCRGCSHLQSLSPSGSVLIHPQSLKETCLKSDKLLLFAFEGKFERCMVYLPGSSHFIHAPKCTGSRGGPHVLLTINAHHIWWRPMDATANSFHGGSFRSCQCIVSGCRAKMRSWYWL